MRRLAVLAAALTLSATASDPSPAAEPPPKATLDRLDLSKVGLPVVWRGRLVNYVFVTVRVHLAPGRDTPELHAKEPYFRDALVRAGHRTPFVDPADLSRVDERAVVAAFTPEARRLAGPGAATGVEVLMQQPRRRLGRPPPDASAGRPITP